MYLSIRDDIVFVAGYQTIAEGCADLGIPAVELGVQKDDTVPAIAPKDGKDRLNVSDPAGIAELKRQSEATGIRIAALLMANNFNIETRQEEIDWAVRVVEACSQLGVQALRIDAIMHGERDLPLPERQRITATAIREVLDRTEGSGVDLGIENHGFQGNDPEFLSGLLELVGSPRLGLTLDSGNFYWRGWPLSRVYEIFREFAPHVKHTHIKNIKYPEAMRDTEREIGYEYDRYVSPIHEGDIDHKLYIRLLKEAGYERDICLEDESFGKYTIEERRENLRQAANFFRAVI